MNQYLSIFFEICSGLLFLFLVIKLLGKTQFSQITPFDFISALILGELVGNAIYDDKVNTLQIAFSVFLWGALIFILETITQKVKRSRKLLEGEPNIVIHKGNLRYNTLKKVKLDINMLQSLIRQQGYFSIQEVEYAIVESNGMVSVLPKSDYDTPKKQDLQLPAKSVQLPITLVMDGEVIIDNLKEAGLDQKWLKDQLAMQSITDYKEVLYAEWTETSPLFVLKYEKKLG